MNRDQKTDIVSELNETFSKAKFAVVADYRGLKVKQLEKLRKNLRENDAQIQVAKIPFFGWQSKEHPTKA